MARAKDDARLLIGADGYVGPGSGTMVYLVSEVLNRWRAIERRIEALSPENPEFPKLAADIEHLRAQYQRLTEQST